MPADDSAQVFSLIYGLKLLPAHEVDGVSDAVVRHTDGTTSHVTNHLIEGTKDQIRALLMTSIESYLDLMDEM